jgi:hypothetical protein
MLKSTQFKIKINDKINKIKIKLLNKFRSRIMIKELIN